MPINQQFIKLIDSYRSPLFEGLVESLESSSPSVSVRFNRRKGMLPPLEAQRVPWAERGWYLPARPVFTFDPALHQGRYYVQEASSMIVGEIISKLAADRPIHYLDSCAAPGGKTTAAIDALHPGSLVVANEFVPRRAAILAENLAKWGYPDVVVSRGDTARFRRLKAAFDIISVDAPCSGEGMFRKDPEAVAQWSPQLVDQCAARQWEILSNLWEALRPGGYLIYSTCTFNRSENEEIVERMIREFGALSIDMDFPADWGIAPGIDTAARCYRFLPNRLRGEGLFVSVVQKPGQYTPAQHKPAKAPKADPRLTPLSQWLDRPGDYILSLRDDTVTAVSSDHSATIAELRRHLDIVTEGIEVATVKGRDFAPTQSLAMSAALNPAAFPTAEVDLDTALTYLRREAVTLPTALPRGYILLTHRDTPLGFVKNLGNRSNNLYPLPWRILKRP